MKIKTKLSLSVGLLFLLIVLLAAIGIRQINKLSDDTKNILVANYNTLDYSRKMMIALDGDLSQKDITNLFETNLVKQQHNVTEIGEQELTDKLTIDFKRLKEDKHKQELFPVIRKDLTDIMLLNMDAILRKNSVAQKTADNASLWIAATGTLCFIIAFTLLINLPSNIAKPIKDLTTNIKAITDNNYSIRLHLEGSTEFKELSEAFNKMASKLEEYEGSILSKLLFEKKRIDTLINSMPDPVIGFDEEKKILFANKQALKITGLNIDEIKGKPAVDVALTNDLLRFLIKDWITKDSTDDNNPAKPLKIYADNKESYFEKQNIEIAMRPTGETEKRYIGQVIILKNITPFKELDFAKTNFIATVSHELKTPISSIKMSLQLLEDQRVGNMNEEQVKLVKSISDDSERLLKITGELLNFSQVETGKIQLSSQAINPDWIVQYALDAVKTTAEQKQITINTLYEQSLPVITVDPNKTAWVMINLLTNAIKHSPANSNIKVDVLKNNNHVVFNVQDNGEGIPKKFQSRIFEKYYQVPGSEKTGTGIGLSICKEFIEAQNGVIGFKSNDGNTNFYFQLPVA